MLKFLILNWKDLRHPQHGGAEIATHYLAREWIKLGASVTIFSSETYPLPREEIIEGVEITRRGNALFSHFLWSPIYYYQKWKNTFDCVIEEIHGIPFFTPLYVTQCKFALIFETGSQIWEKNIPFPFNYLGASLEKLARPLYREVIFFTTNPETKNELQGYGIKRVHLFPLAPTLLPPRNLQAKEKDPTFIFLGRLVPHKQIEDILKAFVLLRQNDELSPRLWIVGRGEKKYRKKLENLVQLLQLQKQVRFWGYVSEEKKYELLQRAWALIVTSIKEGWGLNISEAGICGTTAIVYPNPGLTQNIINGKNGIITNNATPYSLSCALKKLILYPSLKDELGLKNQQYQQQYSWKSSAQKLWDIIIATLHSST